MRQCETESPEELLRAIEEFNRGEWFESHETLEELWVGEKGELRDFYQGMLQLAVAQHHWRNGNLKGALILLESGSDLLSRVASVCQGVDVAALGADARRLSRELSGLGEDRMDELPASFLLKVRLVQQAAVPTARLGPPGELNGGFGMIELLRRRRSIRSYTDQPVARESVELLTEALLRAPSSRNNRPWSFVVVEDRDLLNQLSTAKESGSAFLIKAPLGIVVCADPARSDVWIEDCAIAAILVQLEAQSLGLGSCWIQIRERRHDAGTTAQAYIRKLLGIPEQIVVACIISIGHPAEPRAPVPAQELDYGKICHNRWTGGN